MGERLQNSLHKCELCWQSVRMRLSMMIPIAVLLLCGGCRDGSSVDEANRKGMLILGNNAEPQSFDPHIATSVADSKIINAMMEGVLRGDAADDSAYHPGVARTWERNDRADEWTFHLREDAVWSDGTPLTSADFDYAYHRLLHPKFGGRYADMLYPLKNAEAYNKDRRGEILCGPESGFSVPWERIRDANWEGLKDVPASHPEPELVRKGLNRMTAGELVRVSADPGLLAWPSSCSDEDRRAVLACMLADARAGRPDLWDKSRVGIVCPNSRTVRLELRAPMPMLPLLLLHNTWFPVPAHALEAHGGMLDRSGAWTRPGAAVGNGPFLMAEHRFNDYVEVRKNPRYHDADSVGLNAVRFLPIVNGFTETRMYFDGKLHVSNNVPAEMTAYARRKGGDEFRQEDYYTTIFYRLNVKRPPLNDARVRKALSMALDRESLVRDVAGGAGKPCFGFTPPGAGYETPSVVGYAPDEARRLLAEAGFPGGRGFPRIELMTTSREVQKTMAEAIQAMWKSQLGIEVDIRSCEWTAYKFAQNTMNYDICSSSWSGDYLDPASFLDLWTQDSGNNNTGWTEKEYDEMMRRAHETGDMKERTDWMRRAESLMLDGAPVIPLYWSRRCYLKRPEVQGWHALLLDNHILEDVHLKGGDKVR